MTVIATATFICLLFLVAILTSKGLQSLPYNTPSIHRTKAINLLSYFVPIGEASPD